MRQGELYYMYNTHQLNTGHFVNTCENTVVSWLLNVWPYCILHVYHDSFKTDLVRTTKDDRSSKCFWNTNPCNLHYLYARLRGFGGSDQQEFSVAKKTAIGLVIKQSAVIKNGGEIWTKACVGVEERGSCWAAGLCDFLQLNHFSWVIALSFINAFACLIYISRTLLDVLFGVPVIGEVALNINYSSFSYNYS